MPATKFPEAALCEYQLYLAREKSDFLLLHLTNVQVCNLLLNSQLIFS